MARTRPRSTDKAQEPKEAKPNRLAGFGNGSGESSRADWGAAEPLLVAAVVVSVTRLGGLASFGYTRDGGALSLTVFLDDDRSTQYIKPHEDVDEKLAEIVDYFTNCQ